MQERAELAQIKEFIDRDTPRRGVVIDMPTGLAVIQAFGEDPRLLGFIKKTAGKLDQNEQFFVMYRRETIKEEPHYFVGFTGQLERFDSKIRMVLMWSSHRDPFDNGVKTWLDFYDEWHWRQAVEYGEIALGNVQHSLADFVKEIPINLAYLLRLRTDIGASYMRPKIDPTSPPTMGMRPSFWGTPSIGVHERGGRREVIRRGKPELVLNDPTFLTGLDAITQVLRNITI